MEDHEDLESDVTIQPYASGDEQEILRVFTRVFGVTRTNDAWAWQYPQNPAGLHCFLAVAGPSRRVVSQFCGVPRRMKVRSREFCFSEIVDSLTDPDFRQGLKKPGWFAKTCYAFVDHFGRPDREIIMYGLPNPPAFRVGKRLLGYVHLYHVELSTKSLDPSIQGAPSDPLVHPTAVTSFSKDADDLFRRVALHHEVMTVRDAIYLNWRYTARPDADYEQVEYRDPSGHLTALAVLRHHWLQNPVTVLCELLAEPSHPAGPAIISDLEARAVDAGSSKLQALFRPGSVECAGLGMLGYHQEQSQFRLVARTYDATTVDLDWLREHWYITLGDFDIV